MSYDVFFQRVRLDGSVEALRNPFTGEMREVANTEALSTSERDAVLALLLGAGASEPDAQGIRELRLPDGAYATIHTQSLDRSCAFFIRGAGLTEPLVRLLYDVLVAGRWVLTSDIAAATSADCIEGAARDVVEAFGEIAIVQSPDELRSLLTEGFESWRGYRDRVVGSSDD